MKELDVFRYLKKYRALIAGFSILAGIVFLLVAQLRIQQYTAATVIEYTGSRAAEGLSPDGTPIDTTEIYSTNLVAQAMKALRQLTEGNRLVGIISHVSGLREQIDKKILVTRRRSADGVTSQAQVEVSG